MKPAVRIITTAVLACALAACATQPPVNTELPSKPTRSPEQARIETLEAQLAVQKKECADERRHLEANLRDRQQKLDETQKKLDALIAIERGVRRGVRK